MRHGRPLRVLLSADFGGGPFWFWESPGTGQQTGINSNRWFPETPQDILESGLVLLIAEGLLNQEQRGKIGLEVEPDTGARVLQTDVIGFEDILRDSKHHLEGMKVCLYANSPHEFAEIIGLMDSRLQSLGISFEFITEA